MSERTKVEKNKLAGTVRSRLAYNLHTCLQVLDNALPLRWVSSAFLNQEAPDDQEKVLDREERSPLIMPLLALTYRSR